VRKGDAVQSGSVIGLLNNVKSDDAKQSPELGFELWRNGTPIDPELLIKF
jgi:septal ring factor EnvC (AmiA/AmiB activator)